MSWFAIALVFLALSSVFIIIFLMIASRSPHSDRVLEEVRVASKGWRNTPLGNVGFVNFETRGAKPEIFSIDVSDEKYKKLEINKIYTVEFYKKPDSPWQVGNIFLPLDDNDYTPPNRFFNKNRFV